MDTAADLRLLLASRHPLLLVPTRDEPRVLGLIRTVGLALDVPIWTWSATRGLLRDGPEAGAQYQTTEPRKALDFVADVRAPGVFVFMDAHHALTDPVVLRRVKEVAQQAPAGQTLVLTGPSDRVPPELDGLALVWRPRPPSDRELRELVDRTLGDLRGRRFVVNLAPRDVERLVESLRGLSLTEAERLVVKASVSDGVVDASDLSMVRAAKAQLVGDAGVLELIEGDHGSLDDVGGLDALKAWLAVRRKAMLDPRKGLDPPRGLLLTGVPGCGKSFVAKTLARTWGLPLVLLDPSRLYGPYIGESEQRLADALTTIAALAPAVLWIDEIEKGFAVSGAGDGGVSRRVIGTFLRWLQDRPGGVFIVATCNDVRALPPEFARKGRFDELFFVDLPTFVERRDILNAQLRRRGCEPTAFDLDELAERCDGFSGAEIEAAVVGAMYRAHSGDADLTSEVLRQEVDATVPLSRTRPEEVQALREWARGRAVAATSPVVT